VPSPSFSETNYTCPEGFDVRGCCHKWVDIVRCTDPPVAHGKAGINTIQERYAETKRGDFSAALPRLFQRGVGQKVESSCLVSLCAPDSSLLSGVLDGNALLCGPVRQGCRWLEYALSLFPVRHRFNPSLPTLSYLSAFQCGVDTWRLLRHPPTL
jgi:hypothetical protein